MNGYGLTYRSTMCYRNFTASKFTTISTFMIFFLKIKDYNLLRIQFLFTKENLTLLFYQLEMPINLILLQKHIKTPVPLSMACDLLLTHFSFCGRSRYTPFYLKFKVELITTWNHIRATTSHTQCDFYFILFYYYHQKFVTIFNVNLISIVLVKKVPYVIESCNICGTLNGDPH